MTREIYKKLAENAFKNIVSGASDVNENVYNHITNIGASVMMDRDGVIPGGGFARAINANNLREAIEKADSDCVNYLKYFVYCKGNVFP
jgi:hypothetical protein